MESLDSATADELEHISNFKNKQINVHTTEASVDITKPHRDKKQNQKPIEFDLHSLKSTLDELTTWRIDVDQKINTFRLDYPNPMSPAGVKIATVYVYQTVRIFFVTENL